MNTKIIEQGQLVSQGLLTSISEQFPSGVVHSVGYGSGVFVQQDTEHDHVNNIKQTLDSPMLDLIFTVNDSQEWHKKNLQLNRSHYSSISKFAGSKFIDRVQKFGYGKVYFNPLVTMNIDSTNQPSEKYTREIKYGVIEKNDLLEDLLQWKYLYIAGRLQKPTVLIEKDDEIAHAQEKNIEAALAAALLIKSSEEIAEKQVSFEDLFQTIANISYAGDPRMQVRGEDPEKVSKLVNSPGQMKRWRSLYINPIKRLEHRGLIHMDSSSIKPTLFWKSDLSSCNAFQEYLPHPITRQNQRMPLKGETFESVLTSIVAPAARHQSIKGLISAGLSKSVRYAAAKFAKGLKRRSI